METNIVAPGRIFAQVSENIGYMLFSLARLKTSKQSLLRVGQSLLRVGLIVAPGRGHRCSGYAYI